MRFENSLVVIKNEIGKLDLEIVKLNESITHHEIMFRDCSKRRDHKFEKMEGLKRELIELSKGVDK